MPEHNLVAIEPDKAEQGISITWQVSDVCNFRCSYCNEGNWGGKRPNNDTEHLLKQLDAIITHFEGQGYSCFKFFFSGGEPSFWKPMVPIAEFLHQRVKNPLLAMNTNLSSPLAWWEKHHHLFQDVVASFHIDFADPERFLKTASFLQDKTNYLALRMMMQENRFDEVKEFAARVKSTLQNYALEWVPILDELSADARPYQYTDPAKMEFFKTHGYEREEKIPKRYTPYTFPHPMEVYDNGDHQSLNSNRLVADRRNFFRGWKCRIHESLFISIDGNIQPASCGVGKSLGNIITGKLNLGSAAVICPKDHCPCGTDICITKHRPA